MNPDFQEEKKLWERGYRQVAGLDEAGRGPLAGPVVAAAFMVRQGADLDLKINDSKKLSEKQREYFYGLLTENENVQWGVGIVSEQVIDKINILQATKLAMVEALKKVEADFLLLDGNFRISVDLSQTAIISGDAKVFSIAAASIIAKVTRDRIMLAMHQKYPQYDFDKHKGYGTALHLKHLKHFGPCEIHRKTFAPVSSFT